MANRLPGLFVTDFDGTLTRHDFFRLVIDHFAPRALEPYWQGYLDDRYSHFEALQGIFGSIRASPEELLALVQRVEAPPHLAELVAELQQAGWEVVVASAGCAWYIEETLRRLGVKLEVHANPGQVEAGQGLRMQLPVASPFFSPTHGIDKAAIVRAGQQRGQVVAFAGDGFPDLPAARLVPARHRFARQDLRAALQREGLESTAFETWDEIAQSLCGPLRLRTS